MKPQISVLHNLARSGGTLISRCLGCMEDVVLLSEVHPFVLGELLDPMVQAQKWYDLITLEDKQRILAAGGINWQQSIDLIAERAREQGKQLLLRDWSHYDFAGVPWNKSPRYTFTINDALRDNFEITEFCTVRHPIDQWLSLRQLEVIFENLDVESYMKGYRAFAEKAVEIGFVRFEDFTREPEKYTRKISRSLGLNYDRSFINNWFNYTAVTGDIGDGGGGRHTNDIKINPIKRRIPVPEILAEFEACQDYLPSLELLGYE